jgi:hypothetical protein
MHGQRIKTGFHRIGVVLAGICVSCGAILIATWLLVGLQGPSAPVFAVALFVLGTILYLLARATGWIVAGFAGH